MTTIINTSYIKKAVLLHLFLLVSCITGAQELAMKTNTLGWISGSMNLGLEWASGEKSTVLVQAQYNPWNLGENKKIKHVWVQPEYRFWWKNAFAGSFTGIHLNWANYNIGKVSPITVLKDHRFQGNAIGCGITYGCQWMLGTYWNLEASLGVGYLHIHYKKYGPEVGDKLLKESFSNYVGPYQIGLSLSYFIK